MKQNTTYLNFKHMCLQTTWTEPKVAEKDLIVYKELIRSGIPDVYIAPYCPFKYELGKLYETEMQETDDDSSLDEDSSHWKQRLQDNDDYYKSIGPGFHSATSKKRLEATNWCLMECIIPAGSLYYADGTGLLTSDQIIIVKEIEE